MLAKHVTTELQPHCIGHNQNSAEIWRNQLHAVRFYFFKKKLQPLHGIRFWCETDSMKYYNKVKRTLHYYRPQCVKNTSQSIFENVTKNSFI